jgi:membrane protein
VISHQLQRASSLYGTFGVVLGLLAWLYLQAMVTLYAAEVDAVLVRRLWPRTLLSDSQEQEPQDEKEAPHDGQRAA